MYSNETTNKLLTEILNELRRQHQTILVCAEALCRTRGDVTHAYVQKAMMGIAARATNVREEQERAIEALSK